MEGTKEANKTKLLELGFNNEQTDHALSRTSNLDEAISLLHEESGDTHTSQELMTAPPEPFQRIEMEEVPGDSLDMSGDPPPYEEVANESLPTQLPEGLHSVTEGLHSVTEGLHSVPESLHSVTEGLHSVPESLHSVPESLHSVVEGLHSVPEGLHSVTEGLHSVPEETERGEEGQEAFEFPVSNLYELEGRCFVDNWSIPYKRTESLGILLQASTRLALEGKADDEEHCKRFVDRAMHDCLDKLMTSNAVHRWDNNIQEGISDMLELFLEFTAAKLKTSKVNTNIKTLQLLADVFKPDSPYHHKNRSQRYNKAHWDELLKGKPYAASPHFTLKKDPCGVLVDTMNHFGHKGGFDTIRDMLINTEDLQLEDLNALLQPLAKPIDYFESNLFKEYFKHPMTTTIHYLSDLKEDTLKRKEVGCFSECINALKIIVNKFWSQDDLARIDVIRFAITLRMIQVSHFNSKMNGLIEVIKLIDEAQGTYSSLTHSYTRSSVTNVRLIEWLTTNKVLSIALEGNLHHSQYCDKLKKIVEFLGNRLTTEEITTIWNLQEDQNQVLVDNIHSLLSAATGKLTSVQMDHLFQLIQKSWDTDPSDRNHERLLKLIGKIAKDDKMGKVANKVLELLWDLAHSLTLSNEMLEEALEAHSAILSDSYFIKELTRRQYITKCLEDIKRGTWLTPAFQQLQKIMEGFVKRSAHKQARIVITELQKSYELIRISTNSLSNYHKSIVKKIGKDKLNGDTPIENDRYKHSQCVEVHLKLMHYILTDGALYLPKMRAEEVWDALASQDSCHADRELCYEWFHNGLGDLEMDTQTFMFQHKVLKINPRTLTMNGYRCLRVFFEHANQNDKRLKRTAASTIIDRFDLIGIEYLWQAALEVQGQDIAEMLINNILQVSYQHLSAKLKRDLAVIHKNFANECITKLEHAITQLEATSKKSPKKEKEDLVETRRLWAQIIDRILQLLFRYISHTEENHSYARTLPPHGSTFQGHPMVMYVSCDKPKREFPIECHSNETLGSIRKRIAKSLNNIPDRIQIQANDKPLIDIKDKKVIQQLGLEDEQLLVVKVSNFHTYPVRTEATNGSEENRGIGEQARAAFALEQENNLPSVQLTCDRKFYTKLYSLVKLGQSTITNRVLNLLKILPSDTSILNALNTFYSDEPINPETKDAILNQLFDCKSISAFQIFYNLEVLSAMLMPINGIDEKALRFKQNFLKAGGLNVVITVLQQDSIAIDVDYTVRQGCYSMSLQLARYLLCNKTSIVNLTRTQSSVESADKGLPLSTEENECEPEPEKDKDNIELKDLIFSSTEDTNGKETDSEQPAEDSLALSLLDEEMAKSATETITNEDFKAILFCLSRVSWAAAAGKLQLAATKGDQDMLKPNTCLEEVYVSAKDSALVQESLELLVAILKLRPMLLESFYSLPNLNDLVLDVLIGSPNEHIRTHMQENIWQLCKYFHGSNLPDNVDNPRNFFLKLLLRSQLPYWGSSSAGRNFRLTKQLERCYQYFDLLCRIIIGLTKEDQVLLEIDANSMMKKELEWIQNTIILLDSRESQNLLSGHLMLMKTLFSCEGLDKREYGRNLIKPLMEDFLFSASKKVLSIRGSEEQVNQHYILDLKSITPKCTGTQSRQAAYSLLCVLADNCLENYKEMSRILVQLHHQMDVDESQEWEYMPPVDARSNTGYVGLKNAGATCYMNSVVQQLYMQPGIIENVLGAKLEEQDENNILLAIQKLFSHLLESRLQYYTPDLMWQRFKLWGENINVREQQDAFEFFSHLTDQLDEILKAKSLPQIFTLTYGGTFLDQKICKKGCSHRYESEQPFGTLQLGVKHKNLEESLKEFIKGDLLEGDNAYNCEKCNKKRETLKRTCIKSPPKVLVIQLKRFSYDWEANRAIKFDDYFEFPWRLDIEPYTAEGLARREVNQKETEEEAVSAETSPKRESDPGEGAGGDIAAGGEETAAGPGPSEPRKAKPEEPADQLERDEVEKPVDPIIYELVGVVVHSGQANAGHYYSFIMDRNARKIGKKRWIKFNDNLVEECHFSDEVVQNECFGGEYKAKFYDVQGPYSAYGMPESRLRYWNAYLLFYEKMDSSLPETLTEEAGPSIPRTVSGSYSVLKQRDSFLELSELVEKGEKAKIYSDKIPTGILSEIAEANVYFLRNRDLFTPEYFHFIYMLASINMRLMENEGPEAEDYAHSCMNLCINFLFISYFRVRKKLRTDRDPWLHSLNTLVSKNKHSCVALMKFLGEAEPQKFLRPCLLECPSKEVRSTFALLFFNLLDCSLKWWPDETNQYLDSLIKQLVMMLEKDVVEHHKNCSQYLYVIYEYSKTIAGARHLLKHNAFNCLLGFLLGPSSIGPTGQYNRRWTPQQLKEWHNFYGVLCNLVIITDTKPVWSTVAVVCRPCANNLNLPQDIIPISDEMARVFYHESTERFMKECLLTLRSMSETELVIVDHLCDIMCHGSWCCEVFSFKLIDELQTSLSSFMSNEIKYLFKLLDDILSLQDPFQEKRVLYLFNFTKISKNSYGLNDIAYKNKDHDPRRSYLCIKFYVKLFNNTKCTFAKQFLREHAEVWKWSIEWLKGKLKDTHSWSAVSSVSNETSSTTTLQRTYSAQDTLEEVTAIMAPKVSDPISSSAINRNETQPNLHEEHTNTADSTSQPDMAPFQPHSLYKDKDGLT